MSSLEGSDTWLRILAAEKAGLITVKIEWPEANIKVLKHCCYVVYVTSRCYMLLCRCTVVAVHSAS